MLLRQRQRIQTVTPSDLSLLLAAALHSAPAAKTETETTLTCSPLCSLLPEGLLQPSGCVS